MSRIVAGFRRVATAPGLWIGAWAGMAFVAGLVGLHIRFVVASAVGAFDVLDRSRVVFSTLDIMRARPAVGSELELSVLAATLSSAILWTVLSPLLIARLAGPRTWSELGGRALGSLPGVLVQSLWHLLLRAVLLVIAVLCAGLIAESSVPLTFIVVWVLSGVALDAARVAVVEHDAAPFHIRTAWRGFVTLVRRPGMWVPCVGLSLIQLATSALILWLAVRGYGSASAWIPRLLALGTVGLGLWRLAIVVEDAATVAAAKAQNP